MQDIRFNGKLDCKIDNVGFVNVLRNENYTFEYKTGKNLFSFIYVDSGELDYFFTEKQLNLRLEEGSLLFIPKHLPYKTKYLKNKTKIKIIIFDITGKNIPFPLKEPIPKNYSLEIYNVFASFSKHNMSNVLFLSSKIYELFYIMQNENLDTSKKYKRIFPAVNEIRENYFENNKISFYAALCNMSESNFRKNFKAFTGKSPIEYRNIIRIFEAKKMIDSGEFNISEAAYLVGFNNMSFFYEVYNKYKNQVKSTEQVD